MPNQPTHALRHLLPAGSYAYHMPSSTVFRGTAEECLREAIHYCGKGMTVAQAMHHGIVIEKTRRERQQGGIPAAS